MTSWSYLEPYVSAQSPFTFTPKTGTPFMDGVACLVLSGRYIGYLPRVFCKAMGRPGPSQTFVEQVDFATCRGASRSAQGGRGQTSRQSIGRSNDQCARRRGRHSSLIGIHQDDFVATGETPVFAHLLIRYLFYSTATRAHLNIFRRKFQTNCLASRPVDYRRPVSRPMTYGGRPLRHISFGENSSRLLMCRF
jgi:hypothetical protein